MKLKLILIIFIISFGMYGFSERFTNTVKPELVYDTSSIETDHIIKIGVLFKLKPHWHIYWKNSGNSGLPTKLEFILPDGFEAGDINWPIPNVYKRSEDILDYGYEDDVLLWSDVKVPPDYKKNSDIPVGIKTKWVSCEEICIPGKTEFLENISLYKKNKIFDKWINNLPSKENNKFDIEVVSNNNDYKVLIDHKGLASEFKLLFNPEKALEIVSISSLDLANNKAEISFTASVYPGQKVESKYLDALIAYRDKDNNRKGFEYPINIEDLLNDN